MFKISNEWYLGQDRKGGPSRINDTQLQRNGNDISIIVSIIQFTFTSHLNITLSSTPGQQV